MVGGSQQQAGIGPLIDFLEHDGNQALQFANIRLVAAPLGDGIDLVVESQNAGAASDQLLFQSGIGHDQLWLSRSGNNLQISVIGTSDQVTIQDWYLGQAGHVEQIRTSTGRVLLDTKVDALVSAMAAMVPPAAGQTSLTTGQQMLLAPVLAASWS